MKKALNLIALCAVLISVSSPAKSQDQTVGLFDYQPESYNGLTLFNPIRDSTTYLIDNCGRVVHQWDSPYTPGNSTFLLEDGILLRTAKTSLGANPTFVVGGAGERAQLVDWDGTILWDFVYSDETVRMHHDIYPMPNGNVLILAFDLRTKEEAIAAGRDPDLIIDDVIWSEHIIEVDPDTDEIVWAWYLWDHLIQDFDETKENFGVIADNQQLLNINQTGGQTVTGGADWMHFNSIDYNDVADQIVVNSPFLNEFYVIDHSTTTEEAASHEGGRFNVGGDFIYRWGNPQVYGQGTEDDQKLFFAHNVQWIRGGLRDEGKFLVFNNGANRPDGDYSSVDIIDPPVDAYLSGNYVYFPGTAFSPDDIFWSYSDPVKENFYSSIISGAQMLPNDNILVCSGEEGRFFEITPDKEVVWDYVSPVAGTDDVKILGRTEEVPLANGRNANLVFRITRYPYNYSGFDGRDLTPGDPLELDFPVPYDCELVVTSIEEPLAETFVVYPNPVKDYLNINFTQLGQHSIVLYDNTGKVILRKVSFEHEDVINVSSLRGGIYYLSVDNSEIKKVLIQN